MKELLLIQEKLKVLKDQTKEGIKFKYRTCEEIFEKVKPLCIAQGVLLTVTDDVVSVGDRVYVRATATVQKDGAIVSSSGYAREPDKLMSMSYPQITGSCSSYARKTALGGLFAIDNNEDPDSGDGQPEDEPKATTAQLKELDDFYNSSDEKVKAWIKKYKKDDMLKSDAEGMLNKLRSKK